MTFQPPAPRIGLVDRARFPRRAFHLLSLPLVSVLAGGLLTAAANPQPAVAAEPAEGCPDELVQAADEPMARSEAEAVDLAAECGVPVEVASARGYSERTWAQPSGSLKSEFYMVPRWTRDESGEWVEVDASLVREEDGSVRSSATVSDVRISGGGDGPFVAATDPEGGELALTWPETLPAPSLDGDTATYADVMPDVDLQVTAAEDGFWYALIVHTPDAAANPALARIEVEITSRGLDVSQDADGSIQATDAAGEPVFTAEKLWMWGASEPEGDLESLGGLADEAGSPGRVEEMQVELDGNTLAVIPDADMLADPDVSYPITIDPFFVGKRMRWANVHKAQPNRGWTNDSAWPRAGGMRVGYCGWPSCGGSTGLWRSVVRFKTGLGGRHIKSAAVKMVQTHTGGCGTYPLQLYRVGGISTGMSWNDVNWVSRLQTRNVASSNSIGGCGTNYPNRSVTFNNSAVRQFMQRNANKGYHSINFGVRSGNEGSRNQWRRISRNSLRLEVTHASYPKTPTNLSTAGQGCSTSGPGPWVTTRRPRLTGTPRNDDGNGRYRQHVYVVGGTRVHSFRSGVVTVNRSHTHTVSSADALADGSYRWRMRTESATSGVPASSYRQWCYFRVDATPPPEPSATRLTESPQLGDPVQFALAGSPDTDRFRFNLSGGSNTTVDASGGAATITVDPSSASIDHELQVWALDEAGNVSDRHDVWFTTAKDLRVPVAGVWRFDGDQRDDSGNGHHLGPAAGISFTSDRQGRPDSALRFNGESCTSTDEPVLDTDQSFTIATWVRPAEDGWMTIASQAGVSNTAFRLRKDDEDKWVFVMLSEDNGTPNWHAVRSSEAATGQWQHVAGVYDAATARVRLYVDGFLVDVADVPTTWNATDPLFVGCASSGSTPGWDQFDGDLDELVTYQGVLTGDRIEELMVGGPPAGDLGWWPLRGSGAETGPEGADLTVPGSVTWVPDSHGRAGSAMQLDGDSCAATDGAVVRTDQSFTVSAMARLGSAEPPVTVASQAGENNTAFRLRTATDNRWGFMLTAADEASPDWYAVYAPEEATAVGEWQHVVGAYDADAATITIYVDGVEQGVSDVPTAMWRSGGSFHVGCAADADATWDQFGGAVHDVRVWRGAATPEQLASVATEQVSFWGLGFLDGGFDGRRDGVGGNHLSLHGDFEWVLDQFGGLPSALGLTGTGWAQTNGPVVTTDESFTVSAWAKLDDKGGYRTVLAQGGNERSSLYLNYNPHRDRWQFGMPSEDSNPPSRWHYARSLEAPQAGVWYHLTGVYDLGANEIRLYVGGMHQESVPGPAEPWHTDGEFLIGTAGDTAGNRWSGMVGAIDKVRAYTGVLDEQRILDQGFGSGFPFLNAGAALVDQGQFDTTIAEVPVTLSEPVATEVTVEYESVTPPGPEYAVPPDDYEAVEGTLVFEPGEQSKTIPVTVHGDPDQYVDLVAAIELSDATNATVDGGGAGGVLIKGYEPSTAVPVIDTPTGDEHWQVTRQHGGRDLARRGHQRPVRATGRPDAEQLRQ